MSTLTTRAQISVSCASAGDAALVNASLSDPRSWGAVYAPVATTNGTSPTQFVTVPNTGPWTTVATAGTTVTAYGFTDSVDNSQLAAARRALSLITGLGADVTISTGLVTVAGP